MATLRQAEAVVAIYRRFGKDISFDKVFRDWPKEKASKFIGKHYMSYYDLRSKASEEIGESR